MSLGRIGVKLFLESPMLSRKTARSLLWGLLILGVSLSVAACGGGTEEDDAGSGGSPNGAGGDSESYCGTFDPTNSDCGYCEQSVEEFCAESDFCEHLDVIPPCEMEAWFADVEEGCGYIKSTTSGDVFDHRVVIWKVAEGAGGAPETETLELVFFWDNGAASAGCGPETVVGTEPACDSWVSRCTVE